MIMNLKKQSIVVTGASGQLGRELCRQLGPAAVPLHREQADLSRPADLRRTFNNIPAEVVINCAGWTDVDAAEVSPEDCCVINDEAVHELALICNKFDATFVQLSTDYVFGADTRRTSPYCEDDCVGPINQYGNSKLAGEKSASRANHSLVVRTCGLYSTNARAPLRSRNFANTMLSLSEKRDSIRVVGDQQCTPSYVPHVAKGVLELLAAQATGIYHVVNDGSASWYDFACELFLAADRKVSVSRITTNEYPAAAQRPLYSVLDTTKFTSVVGHSLPGWKSGIFEYIQSLQTR